MTGSIHCSTPTRRRLALGLAAGLALWASGPLWAGPSTALSTASPPVPKLVPTPAPTTATAAEPPVAARAALPDNSIYQLRMALTDQLGRPQALDAHRGQPVLLSMFYTSCQFTCPMLVDALRDTEARLSPAERSRLSVLLVSFDPERDTVEVLKRTADQRGLDPAHWTLARSDAASVRKLAGVLGLQYKRLADGDFNHSTTLILLDAEGRIGGRTSRLGQADPAFVKAVRGALRAAPG